MHPSPTSSSDVAGHPGRPPAWGDLTVEAMAAPSPHNTQPWVLEVIDERTAWLGYDPARLLPDTDSTGRFQTIALGVFAEALDVAAGRAGHRVVVVGSPGRLDMTPGPPRRAVELRLEPAPHGERIPTGDLEARCTNRRPYNGLPVSADAAVFLAEVGRGGGHEVVITSQPALVDWAVDLNTETLFYDLSGLKERGELGRWIRASSRHEATSRDGLSARCLGFPGALVGLFFRYHRLAETPGVKQMLRVYYRRSQRGTASVGWIRGPQRGPDDWFRAGRMLLRLWLAIGQEGLVIHPYGSVITNPTSHRRLAEKIKVTEDPDDELWLLFRIGAPTRAARQSYRLDATEVLR